MEVANNFYRTSVKALIFDKDKRFLLCKEESGLWEFPGGGLDFSESPQDCIKRELWEEMGLKVTKVNKKPSCFLSFMNSHNYQAANIFFETEVENLDIKKSDECVEARFFNKEEALKENLFSNVKKFIEVYEEK